MRKNKVTRLFYQSLHCGPERSLSRYTIHQNHEVVAYAGIQMVAKGARFFFAMAIDLEHRAYPEGMSLGLIVYRYLASYADISKRIRSASAAFGALKEF
jgi:hypothetical protein